MNGKPRRKIKRDKIIRDKNNESHIFHHDFQINKFIASLKEMKNGKAAGYDEITIEQIKHFGPGASRWLLQLLNTCLHRKRIPNSWSKSKVIALPKTGKDLSDPKSYRPISLLCHTYKLYERMVMNCIKTTIKDIMVARRAMSQAISHGN